MRNQIITGDALSMLRTLPDSFVQCCVTSPPYYGLRDYGIEGQIGLENTPQAYIARLVEVFREVKRVMRDDGVLWLNIGDSYAAGKAGRTDYGTGDPTSRLGPQQNGLPGNTQPGPVIQRSAPAGFKPKDLMMIPTRVALALQEDGWYLRSDIIWHKLNAMPESVTDRPTSAHEHVFLLAKSERYFYDADAIRERTGNEMSWTTYAQKTAPGATWQSGGIERYAGANKHDGGQAHPAGRNKRNVWSIASQAYAESHFATMPPKLVEPCILAGTSPRACEHCGAPWERVTERIQFGKAHSNTKYTNEKYQATRMNGSKQAYRAMGLEGPPTPITLGWQPTCTCTNEGSGKCIVLDPFMGAGTVALVAIQHKRDYLGIELNPSYCELINKRIDTVQQGLWTEVAS
jgi:DNA modification methylase